MQINFWVTNAVLKHFQDLKTWLEFYISMGEQHSPPFGILVQFSSKTWSNLFPFRRQDGTLDSSVAVGVALRPGEGESQGGGARRAPASQVALGQEVGG